MTEQEDLLSNALFTTLTDSVCVCAFLCFLVERLLARGSCREEWGLPSAGARAHAAMEEGRSQHRDGSPYRVCGQR